MWPKSNGVNVLNTVWADLAGYPTWGALKQLLETPTRFHMVQQCKASSYHKVSVCICPPSSPLRRRHLPSHYFSNALAATGRGKTSENWPIAAASWSGHFSGFQLVWNSTQCLQNLKLEIQLFHAADLANVQGKTKQLVAACWCHITSHSLQVPLLRLGLLSHWSFLQYANNINMFFCGWFLWTWLFGPFQILNANVRPGLWLQK